MKKLFFTLAMIGGIVSALPVLAIDLPDLSLENATISSSSASYTLRNSGAAGFTGAASVQSSWLAADGTVLATNLAGLGTITLAPGGTIARTSPHLFYSNQPITAARLRLQFNAYNSSGSVAEVSIANNTVEIAPSGLATLDFTIASANLSDHNVRVTVLPVGNGAHYGPFAFRLAWLDAAGTELVIEMRTSSTSILNPGVPRPYEIAGPNFEVRPAGAVRLRIEINPSGTGRLPEPNYSNNIIEVEQTAINLSVTAGTLSNESVTHTITNLGNRTSTGNVRYKYNWINSSRTILATSPLINLGAMTLAPGAARVQTDSSTFITARPADATALEVIVNPPGSGDIAEATRIDNVLTIALPVPDFTIESPVYNQPRLSYVVRNNGGYFNGNLARRLAWLNADGAEISSEVFRGVATIPAGGSISPAYSGYFVSIPPALGRQLKITLDPDNAITEVDETNNETTLERPLPDLTITAAELSGTTLSYTIHNAGIASHTGAVRRQLTWLGANGQALATSNMRGAENLARNASVTRSVAGNFITNPPAGAVQLRVALDYTNTIVESNETNNTREVSPQYPDLLVSEAALTGSGVAFTVHNPGSGSFSGNLAVSYRWLGSGGENVSTLNANVTNLTLGSGATRSFDRSGAFITNPPIGATMLRIVLDPNNLRRETNETNNTFDLVRVLPDVTVTAIDLSNGVRFTILNQGGAGFSGNLARKLEWLNGDNMVLQTRTASGFITMAAGESRTLAHTGSGSQAPEGATHLRLTLDPANAIAESNNDNNSLEGNRTLPDVSVESPVLSDRQLTYSVRNTGASRFTGSIALDIQWLADDGSVITTNHATQFFSAEAGQTRTFVLSGSFVAVPPEGSVSLRVILDPLQAILEAYENNNAVEVERVTPEVLVDAPSDMPAPPVSTSTPPVAPPSPLVQQPAPTTTKSITVPNEQPATVVPPPPVKQPAPPAPAPTLKTVAPTTTTQTKPVATTTSKTVAK